MTQGMFFTLSWLVLAGLLFYPVYKLVFVLSVRRLRKKLERELSDDEIAGQKNRARVLAVILVFGFSFLFNIQTVGLPGRE